MAIFLIEKSSIILRVSQVLGRLTPMHLRMAVTPSTWPSPWFLLAPYQSSSALNLWWFYLQLGNCVFLYATLPTLSSELKNNPKYILTVYIQPVRESGSLETGMSILACETVPENLCPICEPLSMPPAVGVPRLQALTPDICGQADAHMCMCVCWVAQPCLTLWDCMDCSPPGASWKSQ